MALPRGKFPGQTKILKRLSRFPGWNVPHENSFTIYNFLEFRTRFHTSWLLADRNRFNNDNKYGGFITTGGLY